MRLILDTHILLWSLIDDEALPPTARALLTDPVNDKSVSVVSLWEIAIKHRLKRGRPDDMPIDAATAQALIGVAGFHLLPIMPAHAIAVGTLPLDRHADPFDRLLVAQAIAEGATLLTRDAALAAYGDAVLAV